MSDLPNLANPDYRDRVNRGIDYILRNLGGPLDLDEVARAACFSPFHFHRIFRGLMGETLNSFIKRVRLERALFLMSHRDGTPLTEIAVACGFGSSSDFSRSFRKQYGIPPRAFNLQFYRDTRREELKLARLPRGANPDGFKVRLRDLPARRVAYIRVLDSFRPGRVQAAATRLVDWADSHNLSVGQWLGYMWDDPEIVPLSKCRYDVGVEVPVGVRPKGEVSVTSFAAMRVAEIDIAGPIELEQRAIDYLYFSWLPRSGYVPAHQPAFEAWSGLPFAHGDKHFELRAQLPVISASTAPATPV